MKLQEDQVVALIRGANPVAPSDSILDESSPAGVLLDAIETRRETMTDTSVRDIIQPSPEPPPRRRALVFAAAALVVLAAGTAVVVLADGDDAPDPGTPITEPATTQPPATTAPELEITAIDYEYQGVPKVVPTGTRINLVNASSSEFHSAFIIRLDEGDELTRDDLMALSVDELAHVKVLDGGGRGVGTLIRAMFARPGEPQHRSVGPGAQYSSTQSGDPGPKLNVPGRYVIFCLVPVGADPLDVEEQVKFGPPQQIEGVDRHDQVGMFAEFTVEG